jgi:hypothetical protein
MSDEDPDPTVPRLLASPARPSDWSPRVEGFPDVVRATAFRASTWRHPETRRLGRLQPTFFRFSKTCTRIGAPLATRSSVRSGEAPRHAASASLWFDRLPVSDPDRVRPAGCRRRAGMLSPLTLRHSRELPRRSMTSFGRAPVESRWDRLVGASGQRELQRRS